LNVHIDPAGQSLEGTATLLFTQDILPANLRLAPQAVILSIESAGKPLRYTFRNGLLNIDWLKDNTPQEVTIRYRATFADSLPSETTGIEDPSFGVRATISPAGTYLAAGVAWFPQIEGEASLHQVTVNAPPGIIAVTAGSFRGTRNNDQSTISEWHNDYPLEGLALAAGRFVIASEELDDIQLLTFLTRDNADLAPGYLSAMRRHLAYYRERLGPYPFSKFAVVENFLPTGYGMPSWTLLGKSVVRLPFLLDTSLPHEIVHSWWGNAVEVDHDRGNWAEGLATYLADYLLKERDNPQEALEYRRKLLRDYAALVTPDHDFPLTAFTGRMSKIDQAIGYGKGAMVFHQLRREVGDDRFWQALHIMATEGKGRTLDWQGIETVFSKVAGRELRWFFRQWLERRGAPRLTIDAVQATRSSRGWNISGIIRQEGEPYRLDLPIELSLATGEQINTNVRLSGSRTPFTLQASGQPLRLEADPQSHVFRYLHPREVPATINDLLYASRPLVIVADGQSHLIAALDGLIKGLQWRAPDFVNEAEVTAEILKNRDLLLLGWPKRSDLRPTLPPGIEIGASTSPSWQITPAGQSGDVLFIILSRRGSGTWAKALLLAKGDRELGSVASKISHYGRYSQLTFESGRNLSKTTREPAASPLRISLGRESEP